MPSCVALVDGAFQNPGSQKEFVDLKSRVRLMGGSCQGNIISLGLLLPAQQSGISALHIYTAHSQRDAC